MEKPVGVQPFYISEIGILALKAPGRSRTCYIGKAWTAIVLGLRVNSIFSPTGALVFCGIAFAF
jgi:hypothetical protein